MATIDVETIKENLGVAFAAFMEQFMLAQEAGVDAASVIASRLKESLGEEAWANLPISVKMLLG